jgi:hypothetical protein
MDSPESLNFNPREGDLEPSALVLSHDPDEALVELLRATLSNRDHRAEPSSRGCWSIWPRSASLGPRRPCPEG